LGPYTGISYAMHPCIRFSAAPEMEYDKALKWLDRYLIETRDKRLMFDPKEQSFDASFGDEWDRAGALVDADAASSRTGFVISFTNCPVIWTTRISTQTALSSAETGTLLSLQRSEAYLFMTSIPHHNATTSLPTGHDTMLQRHRLSIMGW
jgi:hypothetical protein